MSYCLGIFLSTVELPLPRLLLLLARGLVVSITL
ncbi:unnamed protein product [Amoebophrya sp. A120]|nr:unnamed protein product [Amoebophrya sp. A120]|eukprot:GSA120T00017159001.1